MSTRLSFFQLDMLRGCHNYFMLGDLPVNHHARIACYMSGGFGAMGDKEVKIWLPSKKGSKIWLLGSEELLAKDRRRHWFDRRP